MTRLIDVDKLKQYIDDCKCCEKCNMISFRCDDYCEFPDFLTPQWERVLNEQQTVDAIPIEWIKEYIRTHPASTDIYFKWMIDEWKEEQEKQNDSFD